METKGAYESSRFLWKQKWQKILTATFFPGDHVKSLGESITPRRVADRIRRSWA